MHTCRHPNPKNSALTQIPLTFREELGECFSHFSFPWHYLLVFGGRQSKRYQGWEGHQSYSFIPSIGKYHLSHLPKKHLHMFACELFFKLSIVNKPQRKGSGQTENDSSRPPKHIYDTCTSWRPTLSLAANVSRVPPHHPLLCAFLPRFSSWSCWVEVVSRNLAPRINRVIAQILGILTKNSRKSCNVWSLRGFNSVNSHWVPAQFRLRLEQCPGTLISVKEVPGEECKWTGHSKQG